MWSSTTALTLARDQSVQELLTGSAIRLAIRLTYWKLARCSIDSVGGRKKIMTSSEKEKKSAGAKNVCDEWLSASQSRTFFAHWAVTASTSVAIVSKHTMQMGAEVVPRVAVLYFSGRLSALNRPT
jgi:hypothetical protein